MRISSPRRCPRSRPPSRWKRRRASSSLNRFNGGVGPAAEASEGEAARSDKPLSATTVELYASCPFRGFLRHQLYLEVLEPPERRIAIEPKDRGSLVHEVLEQLVAEGLESERAWSGWTTEDHRRLTELAAEAFDAYERRGLAGKALLWELEKSQIVLDLHRFLESDTRRCAAAGRVPVAAEYSFGVDDEPPLELVAAGRPGSVPRQDRPDRPRPRWFPGRRRLQDRKLKLVHRARVGPRRAR